MLLNVDGEKTIFKQIFAVSLVIENARDYKNK